MDAPARAHRFPFLMGGGEVGELIAAFDWASTPLGPIDTWSPVLKTSLAVALPSPVPIAMLWGVEGILLYNNAYAVIAGARHPHALGSKARESWPEIAEFNSHVIQVGLAGSSLSYRDQEMTLLRNGVPEQVWFNLDYSPIVDEAGRPVAVLALVAETSAKVRAERWQANERERMRQMFEQAPGFMAMLSGPSHVFELTNAAYMQLIGHRDVVGKTVAQALPDVAGQGYFELLDGVFTQGKPFIGRSLKVLLQRAPGAASEERFVDLIYQPIRDPDGDVVGIFVEGADVTERVMAERIVRERESLLRTFAEAMPNHVWTSPPSGEIDWFNSRVYAYSGIGRGELDGRDWTSIVHPDDVPEAAQKWARSLASGDPYEVHFRLRRHDGAYRWHLARALPIRDDTGKLVRWVGANTDIHDQRETLATLELLTYELEHRIKNILAMVGSIAGQTLRGEDIADRREAFEGRLHALSHAHDILVAKSWRGASVPDVVKGSLASQWSEERFRIVGPALDLTAKQTTALSLAIHELATNAAKYGALSTAKGRIEIKWTANGRLDGHAAFELVWRERNGPAVESPTRKGFGSRLITRVLAAEFNGQVSIDYLPAGIVCKLKCALTELPHRDSQTSAADGPVFSVRAEA